MGTRWAKDKPASAEKPPTTELQGVRDLQRKSVQTWAVDTPGIIVLLWLLGVPLRREAFGECLAPWGSGCYPWQREVNTESPFYIADRDWAHGVQLVAATTLVLLLFIEYLRIWKRSAKP